MDGWRNGVRERKGSRARWMRVWGEGEKRGQGWLNEGVGLGREKGARLD